MHSQAVIMRKKFRGYPTPKKPVVVGDMLFTNTSKRWISTANLREDMVLMKRRIGLDSAKRTTGQAHDYNMQVFRDQWARKLDRNRLTKLLETKKEEKKKKEVAAYLRDVYSDSEDDVDNRDESTSELHLSMNKKSKKKTKKKKLGSESNLSQDDTLLYAVPEDLEASDSFSVGSVSVIGSPFVMSSLASLTKYIPDEAKSSVGESAMQSRSIKSAGDIKYILEHTERWYREQYSSLSTGEGRAGKDSPHPSQRDEQTTREMPPLSRRESKSASLAKMRRSGIAIFDDFKRDIPATVTSVPGVQTGTVPTITETSDDAAGQDAASRSHRTLTDEEGKVAAASLLSSTVIAEGGARTDEPERQEGDDKGDGYGGGGEKTVQGENSDGGGGWFRGSTQGGGITGSFVQGRLQPGKLTSATSSFVSKTSVDSASFKLSRLNLTPKALPPIHTMKPRKPAVRPWDYPYAGVVGMSTPPQLLNEGPGDEHLHDQLNDLRYCRYLRLPPSKYAKRKLEQDQKRQARRKEMVYVVAAGRDFSDSDKRIIKLVTENAVGKWMKKTKILGAGRLPDVPEPAPKE